MLSEVKYQCQKKSIDISTYSAPKINIKYLRVLVCKVSLTQLFWSPKYLNWLNIPHRYSLLQNPVVNNQASRSSSFNIIQEFLSKLFNHRYFQMPSTRRHFIKSLLFRPPLFITSCIIVPQFVLNTSEQHGWLHQGTKFVCLVMH